MRRIRVTRSVPDNDGPKALSNLETSSLSKGIASDRMALKFLRDLKQQLSNIDDDADEERKAYQ